MPRKPKNHKDMLVEEAVDTRIDHLTALALRVFGDADKANRWLAKSKNQLGGKAPVDFLRSEEGARIIEEMLLRIEHGVPG